MKSLNKRRRCISGANTIHQNERYFVSGLHPTFFGDGSQSISCCCNYYDCRNQSIDRSI